MASAAMLAGLPGGVRTSGSPSKPGSLQAFHQRCRRFQQYPRRIEQSSAAATVPVFGSQSILALGHARFERNDFSSSESSSGLSAISFR